MKQPSKTYVSVDVNVPALSILCIGHLLTEFQITVRLSIGSLMKGQHTSTSYPVQYF